MKNIRDYFLCFFGAVLVGIGVYFFKVPNHFSTGGVSGVSIVLSGYFHLTSVGTLMTVINIVLLLIGFIFVGRDCGVKTAIGTLALSGTMLLLEKVVPVTTPLTNQPFMELIYAVILPAIGSAILFNIGGSTGGTDIVAMILRKYTSLNIGTALLCSDTIITLGSFLFSVEAGLFAMLGLVLKSTLVDYVIENINLSKCFTIITSNANEIVGFINGSLRRGATVVEAEGGYTHDRKHMIVTVLNRAQAAELRKFLRKSFPDSFMIITNSSEIIGKGFRGVL